MKRLLELIRRILMPILLMSVMCVASLTLAVPVDLAIVEGGNDAEDAPFGLAPLRTQVSPVLDGKLDDPCWTTASFTRFPGVDDDPDLGTEFAVVRDDIGVYVALRCREPDLAQLRTTCDRHDGLFEFFHADDWVEILIDPGNTGHDYYWLLVNASGQVSVVGAITANGGDGFGGAAGGGSGGSVYIHCGTFSGTGSIKANGNPTVFAPQGTGNGGGGRIAVVFTNLAAQAALSPTVAFDLGRGPVGSPGVGTLYFNSPAFYPTTTVAGSWVLTIPGFTEWRPDSFTLNSGTVQFPAGFTFEPAVLTVAAGSELLLNNDVVLSCGSLSVGGTLKMQYPFSHSGDITLSDGLIDVATNPVSGTATFACTGNLVLTNGGRMHFNVGPTNATMPDCGALITIGDSLNVHSNSSLYAYSGNSLYGSPRFSVGGNFNLAATGKVVADGFGLVQGTGPGAGGLGTYGGGGGHGGAGAGGGGDSGGAGGITNGIALAPYAGSGGGRSNWVGYGGNGGGSLKMAIIGDAIVNGAISANGNPGDSCGGGGAGGGIFITCRKFLGSGSLSAKGGKGGTVAKGGGGGGGGCIAVWLNVPETEVARILAGDRKNVAVTSTTPTFTGTLAVDKGENGQAAIVPQAAPGIVSFVKIIPPAVTVIAIR